ncbi:MAG TPA: FtsQ-type POTRA domain-containing protein, partial [Propionibacteriaceae bacterium]
MTATATATRRARTTSTSKNRKKRKKKSRRSWRRKVLALIVIAVIVALLAGGLWVVYYSAAFVTKRVNVVGARNLTPVQVSLTAQVPLSVPLARQDLDAIAERLTTVPSIETATVSRSWPNTITVTIVE